MSSRFLPSAVCSGIPSTAISGSAMISPRLESTMETATSPTTASLRRSFTGPLSPGTSNRPSRNRRPTGISSMISALAGARRTISPLMGVSTCATPASRAMRACSFRCRISPCIGSAICGFTQPYILRNSSRRGCPVTCTSASASVTMSTPMRARLFWMRLIDFSLPGMVRDEKMTMSPVVSASSGCSPSEMRFKAARGSPWLPVTRATTSLGWM